MLDISLEARQGVFAKWALVGGIVWSGVFAEEHHGLNLPRGCAGKMVAKVILELGRRAEGFLSASDGTKVHLPMVLSNMRAPLVPTTKIRVGFNAGWKQTSVGS